MQVAEVLSRPHSSIVRHITTMKEKQPTLYEELGIERYYHGYKMGRGAYLYIVMTFGSADQKLSLIECALRYLDLRENDLCN